MVKKHPYYGRCDGNKTGRTVSDRTICVPHNGSSPCGPTNLEAAYYAAFVFLVEPPQYSPMV